MPVRAYDGLLAAWAKAGFVVAAPRFPFTAPTAPGGLDESDILNHPADLRVVVSSLISSRSPVHRLVNRREVALVGHSDGGDVSLAVAANSCCRDGAVRAAVILSGAELPSLGGAYYSTASPPLLVIQGDRDTVNPPGCSVALYNQAPAPKYYVDVLGATHLSPYLDPGAARNHVAATVIDFLDYYLKGSKPGLARLRLDGASPPTTITSASRLAGTGSYCPG